jgi:hypothetical protein
MRGGGLSGLAGGKVLGWGLTAKGTVRPAGVVAMLGSLHERVAPGAVAAVALAGGLELGHEQRIG